MVCRYILRVVDISNPQSPNEVAYRFDTAYDVHVSGNYAYTADSFFGIRVYDISNPANPLLSGTLATPGEANDIHVLGSYAYVSNLEKGMRVVDVSNPAVPSEVASVDASDEAAGVDVSDPASMSIVSTLSLPDTRRIFASGIYSYLGQYGWGLRAADIQDPLNPVALGLYGNNIFNLDARGAYVYTTDYNLSLDIYDVSNPSAAVRVAENTTLNNARDVRVANGYAYVADGFCGLSIVDAAGFIPYINVTAPGGSETWPRRSTQTITWNSTGNVGNVEIYYSTDGGSAWILITGSTANNGSYQWTLPNESSDQTNCLVKIAALDGSCEDTSNAFFTISKH